MRDLHPLLLYILVGSIILLMALVTFARGGEEMRAQCFSYELGSVPCRIRTDDSAIYFLGKWHTGYIIQHSADIDDQLHLMIAKDTVIGTNSNSLKKTEALENANIIFSSLQIETLHTVWDKVQR